MELVEGGSLQAKVAGAPQPAGWAASLVATEKLSADERKDCLALSREVGDVLARARGAR
jgi:hypothetical protein